MSSRSNFTGRNLSEQRQSACDLDPCLPCRRHAAAMEIAWLVAERPHQTAPCQGRRIAARNICRKLAYVQTITGYASVTVTSNLLDLVAPSCCLCTSAAREAAKRDAPFVTSNHHEFLIDGCSASAMGSTSSCMWSSAVCKLAGWNRLGVLPSNACDEM
jgi:hypothetical protein